jgi:hypothetical protein
LQLVRAATHRRNLLQIRCTWRNARLPMQLTRAIKVGRFDGERCGIRAETIDAGR